MQGSGGCVPALSLRTLRSNSELPKPRQPPTPSTHRERDAELPSKVPITVSRPLFPSPHPLSALPSSPSFLPLASDALPCTIVHGVPAAPAPTEQKCLDVPPTLSLVDDAFTTRHRTSPVGRRCSSGEQWKDGDSGRRCDSPQRPARPHHNPNVGLQHRPEVCCRVADVDHTRGGLDHVTKGFRLVLRALELRSDPSRAGSIGA